MLRQALKHAQLPEVTPTSQTRCCNRFLVFTFSRPVQSLTNRNTTDMHSTFKANRNIDQPCLNWGSLSSLVVFNFELESRSKALCGVDLRCCRCVQRTYRIKREVVVDIFARFNSFCRRKREDQMVNRCTHSCIPSPPFHLIFYFVWFLTQIFLDNSTIILMIPLCLQDKKYISYFHSPIW